MEDMMALRREHEAKLEEIERERQARLGEIPAAAEALARLHLKVQTAEATRAKVFEEADRTLREAALKAETERASDFVKAERAFRDRKLELERQLEDETRKAKERLEQRIREIEIKYPSLPDQTRPKERAHEEYRLELKAAEGKHEREWDRGREELQAAGRDALAKERLAREAAAARADFARSEADRAYEQTVQAAKAIFRMEVAGAAGPLQAEFDGRRQRLLEEWEARKDALSERFRRGRRG
jgi:hypothetical protein